MKPDTLIFTVQEDVSFRRRIVVQKSYGRLEQNKNKEIVTKNDRPASGAGFRTGRTGRGHPGSTGSASGGRVPRRIGIFLAETAGIVGVRRFTQRLQPSARIYVGPGKLEEIAAYCKE